MREIWLDEEFKKSDQVFVGYTSFNRKKITTTNFGIWLGYDKGELFFQMRFRYHIPKSRFGKDVWTHIKSVISLFDAVGRYIKPMTVPLILLPSQGAIKFIEKNTWKNLDVGEGLGVAEKHKFTQYVNIYTPQFARYSATIPPYSMLREMMKQESVLVSNKIVNKGFYDYSNWLTE